MADETPVVISTGATLSSGMGEAGREERVRGGILFVPLLCTMLFGRMRCTQAQAIVKRGGTANGMGRQDFRGRFIATRLDCRCCRYAVVANPIRSVEMSMEM